MIESANFNCRGLFRSNPCTKIVNADMADQICVKSDGRGFERSNPRWLYFDTDFIDAIRDKGIHRGSHRPNCKKLVDGDLVV